jgi:hypothetical protein
MGINIFVLCSKSGQPYDLIMCQGLSTELANGDVAKCASLILHLYQRLLTPGDQIFMDKYFTTYQILKLLKTKSVNAVGTIRVNMFNKPPLLSGPVMKNKNKKINQWHDNP